MLVFALAAWWTWPSRNSPSVTPRLSVVVLPFAHLSNDPDQEHFADGITEDLTTSLSRISGTFVIARNTAFTYKGKPVEVKQIGRELGVRYVLEGSVRRTGDPVRVNVQLIDAENGGHAWADQFDTNRANLAEAQNEIAGRLARTLHLGLAELVGRQIEREASVDPNARDLVMRGWAFYYRPVSPSIRQKALRAFARALEIDPRSVDARTGIGAILVDDLVLGLSASRQQDEALAQEALGEALKRDTNHSMAHFAMGVLRRLQTRLRESQIELETAIALDRNNARALEQLGITLMFLGQPEAAIPHVERAIRLNPHDPNIAVYYWALGASLLVLGRDYEATDILSKARAANPRLKLAHLWLAGALGLGDNLNEARPALAEAIRLQPELGSLERWRASNPWAANPQFTALAGKTLYAGLRRVGFPDE
jgi:TolB-like protein